MQINSFVSRYSTTLLIVDVLFVIEFDVNNDKILFQMNFQLVVYTGTYNTLKLANEDGFLNPVFLQPQSDEFKVAVNKHRVPLYVYKILYRAETHEGIAFLVLNNPNENNCNGVKICNLNDELCVEYGWKDVKSDDPRKGCVFCCDVNQLQKLSKTAFPRIKVPKILRGPTAALTTVSSNDD